MTLGSLELSKTSSDPSPVVLERDIYQFSSFASSVLLTYLTLLLQSVTIQHTNLNLHRGLFISP